MKVKVLGKKVVDSVDRKTGEVRQYGFLYCEHAFGMMQFEGTTVDGKEVSSVFVPYNVVLEVPVGATVNLDYNANKQLQNVDVLDRGGK